MPARILLAEDDDDLRELLGSGLRRDGHEVVQVADGLAALARLTSPEEGAFDLVVSDVRMRRIGGLDLLARLPAEHPPVLLMSGFVDADLADTARALGAVAVISKPFGVEDLRLMAEYLMSPVASRKTTRR